MTSVSPVPVYEDEFDPGSFETKTAPSAITDLEVATPSVPARGDEPATSFYASTAYLDVAARTYFDGRPTSIEYVRVDGDIFRLLVVNGTKLVSDLEFVDYHQPVAPPPDGARVRPGGYLKSVVREVAESSEWESIARPDLEPAPFVDWSMFATYGDYEKFLKARRKGLFNEQRRRRRRLTEAFGQLDFCMHDERDDVLDTAIEWKTQQLRATGARNYLADARNIRHFEILRDRGLLTASTLRVDGRLLSVWLGFVHDGVWSGWIFAYDPDPALRKYSVGKQLLHSMLEESFRLGHREFDFSIGDEDYKWFFATHARILGPVGQPPLGERVRLGAGRAKRSAKAALERHPKLLVGVQSTGMTLRRARCRLVERLGSLR